MKRQTSCWLIVACLAWLNIGCTAESTSNPIAKDSDSHAHSDGTVHSDGDDHEDHDHEHADGDDHSEHDHSVDGHSHGNGPHGGTIVDWGGGTYHLELTVDHKAKSITVYVLGSDEKTPTPIAAEEIQLAIKSPAIQLVLTPVNQEGEADPMASVFQGSDDQLATEQDYEGSISGLIDGTPYSGTFKETVHQE